MLGNEPAQYTLGVVAEYPPQSVRAYRQFLAVEILACGWIKRYQLVPGTSATARRYMDALLFDEAGSPVALALLRVEDGINNFSNTFSSIIIFNYSIPPKAAGSILNAVFGMQVAFRLVSGRRQTPAEAILSNYLGINLADVLFLTIVVEALLMKRLNYSLHLSLPYLESSSQRSNVKSSCIA